MFYFRFYDSFDAKWLMVMSNSYTDNEFLTMITTTTTKMLWHTTTKLWMCKFLEYWNHYQVLVEKFWLHFFPLFVVDTDNHW